MSQIITDNTRVFKDHLLMADGIGKGKSHQSNLFVRTQVLAGYGRYTDNKGITQLHETCFDEENMVLIGGVQYALEQLLGVKGPIEIGTLNASMGIGSQSSTALTNGLPHQVGHKVCLFGVGTGGAGDNIKTIYDVKYNEREIVDMVPFRYTNDALSSTEADMYFGKKMIDGTQAYYLKRFDQAPEIKHFWKDGDLDEFEDGTEVDSTVFTSTRQEKIESFSEILLTVSKKDIKEWFKAAGHIEDARFNSLGLFTGYYNDKDKDYESISELSKLNIPTESLSLVKDLQIIYRLFGS